ncbi:MAG: VanZ family protein, partial [Bacteroidetes bacterium]|nr:VanZ family protein [Bacteroidota bacterium]
GLRKQYQFPGLRYHYVVYALLFGIVLGLITEVMQVFVFTGRSGNVFDFAANTIGCFTGWGAYRLFNRKLRHKK